MEIKAEEGVHTSGNANATAVTNPNPVAVSPPTSSPAAAAAAAAAVVADDASRSGVGAQYLSEMNDSFAKCLSLVCPPIQYPPHCRFNPVQQDAADTMEIETRLEEFFLHAKQIELLFLNDVAAMSISESGTIDNGSLVQQSDLEMEILNLESELNEKHDLIEKYTDVIRGWEGKFKRLESRMAPERE